MAGSYPIQIGQRGVLTFPKALRDKNQLREGDFLSLMEVGPGVFVLSSCRSGVDEVADRLAKEWLDSGEDLESMLAALREARASDDPIPD